MTATRVYARSIGEKKTLVDGRALEQGYRPAGLCPAEPRRPRAFRRRCQFVRRGAVSGPRLASVAKASPSGGRRGVKAPCNRDFRGSPAAGLLLAEFVCVAAPVVSARRGWWASESRRSGAMRIDEAIKRSYVVIVCFLIGAAAYFQVSGLMSLARGVIAEGAPLGTGRGDARDKAIKSGAPSARETSAAAILARNPFDSVTGPLDGSGEPLDLPPAPENEGAPCAGVRVVLISESDDPGFSFAAISEGTQKPILRRMGDMIAGYAVDAIVRDRVRLASGV